MEQPKIISFKKEYLIEDFNLTFPLSEMVINHIGNSVPKYNRVWNYSNKLLMCISDTFIGDKENNIEPRTDYTWVMFKKDFDNNSYIFLYFSDTYEDVVEKTHEVFNPPLPKIKCNDKDIALEMIQNNIMSCLKKAEPISKTLKKSACTYIYYVKNEWRCFYPTPNMLIEFHNKENSSTPNQKYLDFLSSDEFADIRNVWNKEPAVSPGA